ncbi:MAG: hypothetical protein ACREBS_11080 [Nitrososphaerales archaeon]
MTEISTAAVSKTRFNYYESCKMILGVACVALSLGWGKYIGKTVYLPFYPDSMDILLGVSIGLFLIFDYAKCTPFLTSWRRARTPNDPGMENIR